ncbi:anti-sigma factor domain-containing protein [Nocardia sp. NPDC127526]|uniref:anti-sigma factor n=1 Tax=Nocardia sp. NPDC127526 TaxID=3345393 RepID=UPI003641DF80
MPDISRSGDLAEFAHPYALDALTEAERRSVDALLNRADEVDAASFRTTVREIRETLATMTTVDAQDAPAALEASIQQALDEQIATGTSAERPGRASTTTSDRASGTTSEQTSGMTSEPSRGIRSERAAAMRSRRALGWVAAAAAAAALVIGGFVVKDLVQHRDSETLTAERIRTEGDARTETAGLAGGGSVTVDTSRVLDAALVFFDDVPAPSPGRAYQLWLIPAGGTPVSAGVPETLPTESSPLLVRLGDARTLAVSIEPVGGSPQPTTDPIVAVPLG